jgi:predicted nuclease of predicted toxin-antitoxin system
MKVLLDECAPKQLQSFLVTHGHECRTVQEAGWSGIENGGLLTLADSKFDVLVTIDKGIQHQQNMAGRNIAIVIVRGRSNRLVRLSPYFPACAETIKSIRTGEVVDGRWLDHNSFRCAPCQMVLMMTRWPRIR